MVQITDSRKIIKTTIILLFLAFIIGYSLFQAKKLIQGPLVYIQSPSDGSEIHDSNIEITGSAYNIAFMYLNGRKIYTDDKGYFNEDISLYPGHNVIELQAEDKFGRLTKRLIRIYRNI